MVDKKIMTEEEKQLLQAKRRLEAAEARNRKQERNQRTRRLIQIGAILESVLPEVQSMELEEVKQELKLRLLAKTTNNA